MILKRDFEYINGTNRPLHIYLPDGYPDQLKQYPVMYFFDGHNLFYDSDATYGKSWGLKEFMDQWIKKMIIVGIECGHEGSERLSEYLPYFPDEKSWLKGTKSMGDATMRWIVDKVKPYIDHEFDTMPFRECTGIAGSSMGGIMALFAAIRYNRWFSKAACLSSSIGPCLNGLMKDIEDLPISPDTRIYLSWGTREAIGLKNSSIEDTESLTYQDNKRVANAIVGQGALVKMYCQIEGGHNEASWGKQIPDFMNYLWL